MMREAASHFMQIFDIWLRLLKLGAQRAATSIYLGVLVNAVLFELAGREPMMQLLWKIVIPNMQSACFLWARFFLQAGPLTRTSNPMQQVTKTATWAQYLARKQRVRLSAAIMCRGARGGSSRWPSSRKAMQPRTATLKGRKQSFPETGK